MNRHVAAPDLAAPQVTTGPLPASRKIYAVPPAAPELRVPLREIALSPAAGEPALPVYDTSGPYSDPEVKIDVSSGLEPVRASWIHGRGGVEAYEGRAIKPEDNGNAGERLAVRMRAWRGLRMPPVGRGRAGRGVAGRAS